MPLPVPAFTVRTDARDLVEPIGERRVETAVRAGVLVRSGPASSSRPPALDPPTRAAAAQLTAGPRAVLCGPTAAVCTAATASRQPTSTSSCPYGRVVREPSGPRRPPQLLLRRSRSARSTVFMCSRSISCDRRPGVHRRGGPRRRARRRATRPFGGRCRECEEFREPPSSPGWSSGRTPRHRPRRAACSISASPSAESPPRAGCGCSSSSTASRCPRSTSSLLSPTGAELYRLDLAWPQLGSALEYDGHAVHAGREDEDAAREDELRRRGWIVIRARAADQRRHRGATQRPAGGVRASAATPGEVPARCR